MTHELTNLDDLFTPVELPDYTPEELDCACNGLIDILSDCGELTTIESGLESCPVATVEFTVMNKSVKRKSKQWLVSRKQDTAKPATLPIMLHECLRWSLKYSDGMIRYQLGNELGIPW